MRGRLDETERARRADPDDDGARDAFFREQLRLGLVDPLTSFPIVRATSGTVHGWSLVKLSGPRSIIYSREPGTTNWRVQGPVELVKAQSFVTVSRRGGDFVRSYITHLSAPFEHEQALHVYDFVGKPPKGVVDTEKGAELKPRAEDPILYRSYHGHAFLGEPNPYGRLEEITCKLCLSSWVCSYLRGKSNLGDMEQLLPRELAERYGIERYETGFGAARWRRPRAKPEERQGGLFQGAS